MLKKKKKLRGFIWNEVPESAGKSKVKNLHPSWSDKGNKLDYDVKG